MSVKTTSLETSKLLKEAGFSVEDSEYQWLVVSMSSTGHKKWWDLQHHLKGTDLHIFQSIPAPTTDELLEELPLTIRGDKLRLSRISNGSWIGQYGVIIPKEALVSDLSLCEVLSAMWLWLKKEGLIK